MKEEQTAVGMNAKTTDMTFDTIIVGAGFAGMYMLHKARELGLRAVVIDANDDVGGCWYSTRYPGLRCDVLSMQYSYSFSEDIQQEWEWPDRYSPRSDIARYASYVADKLDLRRDIRFGTRVTGAHWMEQQGEWRVTTDQGDTLSARFCILATGSLSTPMMPDIPGIADFAGDLFHTSAWPDDLQDFSGRRVAIIGTGSSGVQIAAEAAKTADSLHVVQRTVPYVLELRNTPLSQQEAASVKRNYRAYRARGAHEGAAMIFDRLERRPAADFSDAELEAELERCWQVGNSVIVATFTDVMTNRESNERVAAFIRRKIGSIVTDPVKAHKVIPTSRFAAKRLAISTNYYEIFNRPNVDAINLADTPIVTIMPEGIQTSEQTILLDTIILATGYDAGTGPLRHVDIRGVDGIDLNRKWADTPSAYLGLMTAGFPNMFVITGPGSPSVLRNVIFSIEQHVEWIAECLDAMRSEGLTRIEADSAAEAAWADRVTDIAAQTIYMDIDTWYNGANVDGKKKHFLYFAGGIPAYAQILSQTVNDGYVGFHRR